MQEDEAEEMAKTKYWNINPVAGDTKLTDRDGDGNITTDNRGIVGNKNPVWTAGLTNIFSFKNLSLSIFLSGIFDITRENESVKFERQLLEKNANYINGIKYWTPDNKSNEYTRPNYRITNHSFYTNASYVRIQDVNLAYRFPQSLLNKIGIQGPSTYVNARNLYTFSGAMKFTPNLEQNKYSLDAAGYPTPSVFIFGVNLTF